MTTKGYIEKKRLENPPSTVKVRIKRRDNPDSKIYSETFEIPYRRNLNVISALMDIRKHPVTADGKKNHAAGLGHELSGAGLRDLPDGDRRPCAAVVLGSD